MNITTALIELVNATTTTEWPFDNKSYDDFDPTMSLIITPITLAAKYKHNNNLHTESVSPVTLSTEWTRLTRLIFLTLLSVIGSVGNIFMISSVMIEDHLKKAGWKNL
jgi:hypothetical protein